MKNNTLTKHMNAGYIYTTMQPKSRILSAIFFITFLLHLLSTPSFAADELPDFGSSGTVILSKEQEKQLGSLIAAQIRNASSMVSDPLITDYVTALGKKLVSHSAMANEPFRFFVINDPRINAFATPGGNIAIHTGLILAAKNESELASVMAHEIAHVTQRHIVRYVERSQQFSLPTLAAIFGSLLIASQNPTAGTGALVATMGAAQQMAINFTRDNEQEADRIGMQLLADSGFNPRSMADFFARMQQANRYNEMAYPEFLRTHPVTQARIADTIARAEQLPTQHITENPEFYLIQNRVGVLFSSNVQASIKTLQHRLEKTPIAHEEATRYGYTLALYRNKDYTKAEEEINRLLAQNSTSIAYQLLASELEFDDQAVNSAFDRLESQLKQHPHDHAIALTYAQLLLQNPKKNPENAEKAQAILREQRFYTPEDPVLFELLAQAQATNGHLTQAHLSRADYLTLLGDIHGAIAQLDIAIKQNKGSTYDLARVKARRAQLVEQQKMLEERDW